jgi:8-oxo-dGTP pyrophosphatase MutT (NUDIX family)
VNTKYYVLGFAFFMEYVILIHKKRGPAPVVDKLNGIGGRIEPTDQSAHAAMVREFHEETGLITAALHWRKFATMNVPSYNAVIHCFSHHMNGMPVPIQMTDEPIAWYKMKDIPKLNTVPNLRWLVPMAADPQDISATIYDRS